MPISKSRNVSGYVKAALKYRVLHEKTQRALADMLVKLGRLSGGQKAEADRLLAMDPATLACLAKPCKKEPVA